MGLGLKLLLRLVSKGVETRTGNVNKRKTAWRRVRWTGPRRRDAATKTLQRGDNVETVWVGCLQQWTSQNALQQGYDSTQIHPLVQVKLFVYLLMNPSYFVALCFVHQPCRRPPHESPQIPRKQKHTNRPCVAQPCVCFASVAI